MMKMLTNDQIHKLCKETQRRTSDYLIESEKKRAEQIAARKESQEKQYQYDFQIYQRQMENYQHQLEYYQQRLEDYKEALKRYEFNTEQEEIEYPKRVKAWEESEEQRKKRYEQDYENAVARYEQRKQQAEAAGRTYNDPFPKKMPFISLGKPIKRTYGKPSEPIQPTKPTEPKKPDEKQSSLDLGFSSLFSMIGLMFTSSFSERAIRQLSKMDLSNPGNKDKAFPIIFRELYLNKRISMECSPSEGRGVSPSSDGLYGEKLTVFELELCIFAGYRGNILHNLEIEVGNRTVQIDVLFITQKGIFVIESKNYSGSISGAEYQNKWTLRTPRKNYYFYNPITQNQTHINTLARIIPRSRFFSLIAFSERCDLEYIDIHRQNVFVFNRYALRDVIYDIFSNEPDILSVQDVETITNILHRYCADNSETNPNYKESRSYYSSQSKASEHPNASYQHHRTPRRRNSYNRYAYFDDDYDEDDYDDFDDDSYPNRRTSKRRNNNYRRHAYFDDDYDDYDDYDDD